MSFCLPIFKRALSVLVTATLLGSTLSFSCLAQTEPIRERLRARALERMATPDHAQDDDNPLDEFSDTGSALSCAEWAQKVTRLERLLAKRHPPTLHPNIENWAYGKSPRETLDVYLPSRTTSPAPIIVMVHGGGWCVGDKQNSGVINNKVARWLPKGFIFISLNYPMVGDGADAFAQAKSVASAIAAIQTHAKQWGGDPQAVMLMGHSAGAHLVSLVNADEKLRKAAGMQPVVGTVSLDAGAIDVVKQMPNVYSFLRTRYREAFGNEEARWIAASPYHQLSPSSAPWLGVCSINRKDQPCEQSQAYALKSRTLRIRAEVYPVAMNHGSINQALGKDNDYTRAVEAFMATLSPALAERLR